MDELQNPSPSISIISASSSYTLSYMSPSSTT